MKLSGGVEWALHCCVVLAGATMEPVPAATLATLHDVSPSYLAKQLQALSRAGLIRSLQGHAGGYVLARAADRVTVLDVVTAVDGAAPAFTCTEVRQRGPLAARPQDCLEKCGIHAAMDAADAAWRGSLQQVTIADLAGQLDTRHPGTLATVGDWLAEN